MKHLKKFTTETDYEAAKDSLDTPTVSLTLDERLVHYDKYINNNGHEYVDLGLPSGTLWATVNIGQSNAIYTDGMLYFLWGDTQGYTIDQMGSGEEQKEFSDLDYKWYDGSSTFTKYNSTDNKTKLDLEDDAVAVNWGGDWHMPSVKLMLELTDPNNVTIYYSHTPARPGKPVFYYLVFVSVRNGNSMIMPISYGILEGSEQNNDFLYNEYNEQTTCMWTRAKVLLEEYRAHAFVIYTYDGVNLAGEKFANHRWYGLPVRGVIG